MAEAVAIIVAALLGALAAGYGTKVARDANRSKVGVEARQTEIQFAFEGMRTLVSELKESVREGKAEIQRLKEDRAEMRRELITCRERCAKVEGRNEILEGNLRGQEAIILDLQQRSQPDD